MFFLKNPKFSNDYKIHLYASDWHDFGTVRKLVISAFKRCHSCHGHIHFLAISFFSSHFFWVSFHHVWNTKFLEYNRKFSTIFGKTEYNESVIIVFIFDVSHKYFTTCVYFLIRPPIAVLLVYLSASVPPMMSYLWYVEVSLMSPKIKMLQFRWLLKIWSRRA